MVETVFYIFGCSAVLAALMCITQRNPIASAFWLVVVMLALAGIFVLLNAQFIGILQVLVYAGAIMVLFLFVIMLLNLGAGGTDLRGKVSWVLALGIAGALTASLMRLARYTPAELAREVSGTSDFAPDVVLPGAHQLQAGVDAHGVVGAVAAPLFQTYLIPFLVTGVLLLTAIVGAVLLAKRKV